MTLSKQTKANRENAKQSTGPITEKGKEIASQNATTFGLFSQKLIIDSNYHTEDKVEYDFLIEDLRRELDPQSYFQESLIRKIANTLWRSQRASIAEVAHINKQLNNLDEKIERELRYHSYKMTDNDNIKPLDFSSPNSKDFSNLVGINSIPDKGFAARILYYEMRLDRQLTRTYNLLSRLQRKEKQEQKEKEKNNAISKNEPILL